MAPTLSKVAHCHLEGMAAELLTIIMEDSSDLTSLYNLICASPRCLASFNENQTLIIERVMTRTMPTELHDFPRWIAITASLKNPSIGPSPYSPSNQTMVSFLEILGNQLDGPIGDGNVPRMLSQLSETQGPRMALLAAERVQKLEKICLVTMLTRVHELKEGHPPGPRVIEADSMVSRPLIPLPVCSFTPCGNWEPSWVERLRVQRALWQIFAGCSVKWLPEMPATGASRENGGEWGPVFAGPSVNADQIVGAWNRGYQRGDEYDCVYDTLQALFGCRPSALFTGQTSEAELEIARQGFLSATQERPATWNWAHEPQPVETEEGERMGRSRRHGRVPNYATWFYVLDYRYVPTSGPFTRHGFRAVSRLGLAIWDALRLRMLKLAHPPGLPVTVMTGVLSPPGSAGGRQVAAWRSVILQELARWDDGPVMSEEIDSWMDAWSARVVGSDWAQVLKRMRVFWPFQTNNLEDGEVHNKAVMRLLDRMLHEAACYQSETGQPPW